MLLGSKFTLFHTYSEDKILSKYIQVGSHVKWPVDSKIATILTSVYTVQKLWTKISAFNKNVQKSHMKLMSKKKDMAWFLTNQKWALYILKRIYKGRICTERIFHIFKIQRVFFLTIKVIAFSTQFFGILENFDIQKIIERLEINPNFKKQNEDHRLNFDMKFWFSYIFLYIKLKIRFFLNFYQNHT